MVELVKGDALAVGNPVCPNGELEAIGFPNGDCDAIGPAAGGFPNGLADGASPGAGDPANGEGAPIGPGPVLAENGDAAGAPVSRVSDGIPGGSVAWVDLPKFNSSNGLGTLYLFESFLNISTSLP